jgi:hypothetical protein
MSAASTLNYQRDPNSHRSVGRQIIDRLSPFEDPSTKKIVVILRSCRPYLGWRCKSPFCAGCMAWKAIRNRREIERVLAELPPGMRVAHLTIGIMVDHLGVGLSELVKGFARLRRLTVWKQVVDGGKGQLEFLPSIRSGHTWNLHAHVAVLVHESCPIDVEAVREAWSSMLAETNTIGSFDWQWAEELFVPGRSTRGGPFLPDRVLRDQEEKERVAPVFRRPVARTGSGDPRPANDDQVWQMAEEVKRRSA